MADNARTSDPFLAEVCRDLAAAHAVHTILLYGSRADGSASIDSDYDIACFGPVEQTLRVAKQVRGVYLDVFVYPEAELLQPGAEYLKLRPSRVLLQRAGDGDAFLRELDAVFARGPEPLPADEVQARKVWAHKMLARIQRHDPEGNYRRVWLLWALLEDYFHIRGLWYQGPKKALRWLQQFDAATSDAMTLALKPDADMNTVSALVHRVVGRPDETAVHENRPPLVEPSGQARLQARPAP